MSRIIIPYKPRDAFLAYHQNTKRFSVSVCHRRAGKTVARVNRLIKDAVCIERQYPPGRFAYVAPFRNQAKKIAWLYAKHYSAPLGCKINEGELTLTMPHNGATLELYGADNAEAMRGNYFDGIALDEAQGIAASVLTQIMLPCVADYQGWLDCSGTPRGWSNLLGGLVKMARDDPASWFLQILKASESGILPPEELKRQQALMSPDQYAQEYECSFDAAVLGAYYGVEMRQAEEQGRIRHVPYDPAVPVHTAWDLGYKDDTAIWWYQVVRGEIHLIDFFCVSGANIEDLAKVILSKPYKYGTHYLPHDARAKTLAAAGKSIIEQMAAYLGLHNLKIVPELSVQDGIQAARMALPICWFDKNNCRDGIDALKAYEREFDEDRNAFRLTPKHNWASHPADAFRMMAVGWREEPKPEPKPDLARPLLVGPDNRATLEDVWASAPKRNESRI